MDRHSRPVNALPRRRSRLPGRAMALALLAALPLPMAGCSFFEAPIVQRGHRVPQDQLSEIVPGVQTKQDVQALLGSPTQTGTFSDNIWYYISSKTRQRPGRALAVSDQETVAITFDNQNVVQEVKRIGEDQGRRVEMVSRETPVPGNDRTLLQALFGNIGSFGPGAGTLPNSAQQTPGPGTLR
ncbi:outer membrane protein assembly factor BamE [Roseicella sp. DB1501]|uniref:outer membrane protein assembly factor BamE n=1 Tax=Roseicella sp. DB1501 TaxID=2730925 RepID=UPI0020C30EE4|nr:outer membrane protein assembly factor BamE [Roseicella sp. DB1501]